MEWRPDQAVGAQSSTGGIFPADLALTEAIYVYKTEKEWTKALIGRYLKVNDPESLERAYNSLKTILPETPSPTPDGVKTLLDDIAVKIPRLQRPTRETSSI